MNTATAEVLPIEESRGVTLTPHQQIAYDQIRDFLFAGENGPWVAVLEGYAGTGKTTLVGKMVRELGYPLGMEVAIAAPTNKAVSVLSRKIDVPGVEARTIHSLLGQTVSSDDNGQKSARQVRTPELDRFDLIVIDECSMISSPMLRDIMEHRGPQTRILFVGDPAQLPPVGEAIESPVFRDIQLKFRLSEIVRQAADNPIIAMTMPIRQAIEEQRRVTLEEIAAVIPQGATQACILAGGMQNVQSIAAYEQHRGTDCRIVAYRNSRVHAYNAALHTALHGADTGGPEFSPGERVMVQQEFRCLDGRRIYNGEELVFEGASKAQDELEHDAWHATFRRDGGSTVRAVIPTRSADIERAIKALWKRRRPLAARGALRRLHQGIASHGDHRLMHADAISLTLPWPPSTNAYWRHVGNRTLLSKAGRAYKVAVRAAVLEQIGATQPIMAGPLALRAELYPPDRRRTDIDNRFKSLFDAITFARVWEDDSQVVELHARMLAPTKGGACLVEITTAQEAAA